MCSATATITAEGPTTFCDGGTVRLTASGGVSWLWSTGATTQSISVTESGHYTVSVTTSDRCTATSAPLSVTVHPRPDATITAGGATTLGHGGQVTLTANAAHSWSWSTGAVTQAITVSASGTYSVTVTDANGCSRTSAPVTVTVVPPPPVAIAATAVSGSRVDVAWIAGASEPVVRFEIYRTSGGSSQLVGTSATTSFADLTVVPNTAYLYRVRTVTAAAGSALSAPDLATTILFTDDPLVAGVTVIRATHVAELRAAINAARSASGLASAAFEPLIAGVIVVRASDIEALRTLLNEARAGLGLPSLAFSDPSLAAGVIRRAHLEELRGGVK